MSVTRPTSEATSFFRFLCVLLINDVKDSCGASYGHAYRNGWTFSVASKDCAISQLTFSHGIAHNFGVDHSSGYFLKKRAKKEFVRAIMQKSQDDIPSHTGVPANFMHFDTHIAKIAALGDESCICYAAYQMKYHIRKWHFGLKESCTYKSINLTRKGGLEPVDDFLDLNDIRKKIKKQEKKDELFCAPTVL